ncbi:MAG: YbbR-like domain-containing protein [Dethiobacteria bacterium]|jgi:YbbR domain-containing protein|nr:hypothetical protein [Bacillota bacterium]
MMEKFFRSNNFIKIIAFLLAVSLWLFVSGENAVSPAVERHTFTNIPLNVRNLGDNLVVVDMPDSITLTLQGASDAIAGLTPADLEVYVDLRGKDEGRHRIKVNGEPPPGVTIVNFSPSRVEVEIEELIAQQMAVQPRIIGSPADGLTVGEPLFTPEQVFVKGAASVMEQVEKIVFTVNVQGYARDIETRLPLAALDASGRTLDGLSISPSFAEVKIPIGYPSKEVQVEPVFVGEPAEGYLLQDFEVRPSHITISGTESILAGIDVLFTEEIDIEDFTDGFTVDVPIVLPPRVELDGEPYVSVKVAIVPE